MVTPRVHPDRYEDGLALIARDLARFQGELDSLKIPLRLDLFVTEPFPSTRNIEALW